MKKVIGTIFMLFLSISIVNAQDAIENVQNSSSEYRPGDHELLIGTKADILPKGKLYFTSYELFFVNFGYGITDYFQVGIFSLFPVTSDFTKTIAIGGKYRFLNRGNFAMAANGNVVVESGTVSAGLIGTYKTGQFTLNGNFNIVNFDADYDFLPHVTLVGIQYQMSRKTSLMAEYITIGATKNDFSDSFSTGVVAFGFRWAGKEIAVDLGGLRPTEATGDIIMWPFLKGTIIFNFGSDL